VCGVSSTFTKDMNEIYDNLCGQPLLDVSLQSLLSGYNYYDFACGSVWLGNLVSDIKGGTSTKDAWVEDAEGDIWKERWSNRRVEKAENGKLHNLYSSPSIIRMIKSRRMRSAGACSTNGDRRNVYRSSVGEPQRSIFIFEGCILLRLLLQYFFGGPSIATVFFECFYYYYTPTTCFSPYGPS
jgi:hypothetical protein